MILTREKTTSNIVDGTSQSIWLDRARKKARVIKSESVQMNVIVYVGRRKCATNGLWRR